MGCMFRRHPRLIASVLLCTVQRGVPKPDFAGDPNVLRYATVISVGSRHFGPESRDEDELSSFNYHATPTWYWARTRDKTSHGPIPIPLGYRGHGSMMKFTRLLTYDTRAGPIFKLPYHSNGGTLSLNRFTMRISHFYTMALQWYQFRSLETPTMSPLPRRIGYSGLFHCQGTDSDY
ncbi:hypothetical protein TNCV_2127301 [Trichonephila clavipes]|nr:hypothetical protein TNCV_2127301 [Trichonephila clavipes]